MTMMTYESAISAIHTCSALHLNNPRDILVAMRGVFFQTNYIKNAAFCTMITCSALQLKSLRDILIRRKNCPS